MRRKRGQATVEFGLVSIILLLFFFVLIDGARLVYAYQTVAEATTEGAHTAELVDASDAQVRAAINSHSGLLGQLGAGATINPATTRNIGATVQISVTYNYSAVTPFLSQFNLVTLSSRAVVVVE
jgi:Flp pilus assembly protein TadG